MKNLNNTNYDPIEVYSDSQELEYDTSPEKLDLDTKDFTKDDKLTDNPTRIDSVCMIKDNDFNSLCLSYIVSKQMQVVI